MLALALAVVLQQDAAVLDVPLYRNAAYGVSLPRPFEDWVFAPATERGTTTVIFQPRAASLSNQLWGVLVLTHWGRELHIGDIADRRISDTWRRTLGSSFRLLARDSVTVSGCPAIHAVMTGAISSVALDVEEYLIASGTDLVVLQFRYPRGAPRDSVAQGYTRALQGLRIEVSSAAVATLPGPARTAPRADSPTDWTASTDRGQLVFNLPDDLRAAAPGLLTAELVADRRRVMRFTPLIGVADTAHYAIGRFQVDTRRVGRLVLRVWRNQSSDPGLFRVTDSLVAVMAQIWGRYWTMLGAVPTAELSLVETAWPNSEGAPAMLFLGADATDPHVLRRELARTWFGGVVGASAAGSFVSATLPEWAAFVLAGAPLADSAPAGVRAIELARQSAGEDRFRQALRTLLVESRGGPPATEAFLKALGDTAAFPLLPLLP